jgi:hypothetical protein
MTLSLNSTVARLLPALAIALILGCRDQSRLTSPQPPTIAAALVDGSHGGNPHFLFLPPIAPTATPNGPFNPRLVPVVEICSALEAPCATGHSVATLGPVTVQDTTQYHVNWNTRLLNLPAGTSVRIIVRIGTTHILGFADVDLVPSASARNGLPNANLQLVNGQTLPIKFRIEQGALTPDHTCTDCVEQTISTSTASATVVTSTQAAGAFFPQGALPQDVTVIIEATPPASEQSCIPVSVDQFPGCYTFATDPGPTTFNTAVTAAICVEADGLTADQIKSLILYKLDIVGETNVVTPLENAPAAFLPCNSLAARHGHMGLFARARDAVLRLLVPAPLNAAHLGVGGLTGSFSKIGWGLPPTMSKVAGTDGLSAAAGTPVVPSPAVRLTNSHGGAVRGLPITFAVASGGGSITAPGGAAGSPGPVTVRTDGNGVAALGSWTLGSALGSNTVTASEIGALGSPLTFTATGTGGVAGKPLYVANAGGNTITVYAAGASGNATPTATIAGGNTGLNGPFGIALDGAGNIYVANGGNAITVYAAGASGNAPPMATIAGSNTGLNFPFGIALDGAGKIYVTNLSANSITVYAAGASGNATPTATITGGNTGLFGPIGIALDGAGNIYVANFSGSTLTVYAAGASGNATPTATIAGGNTGLNGPRGIAVDGAGNIYVSNQNGSIITVYAAGASGNVTPAATIAGGNTGLNIPALITF